jgi:hypothetical protein
MGNPWVAGLSACQALINVTWGVLFGLIIRDANLRNCENWDVYSSNKNAFLSLDLIKDSPLGIA